MKKYLYDIAALACATVALAGCIQNVEWTSGTPIRFGASAQAESLTRTEYGAIVDGSPRKQMVNWRANDTLRIVCAQASTAEAGTSTSADYKTSVGVRYNNSAESRATLTLAGNNDKGLRWGSTDAAHIFYAVYPSPAAKSGDALTTDGALTGSIPAVQKPDSINNASPYKALPDMKNQYMVAKRIVEAGKQKIGADEVLLNFTPITTAIQFGIKNGMTSDLGIQSIQIISASKNLSGTFTTSLAGLNEDGGAPYPSVTAGVDAGKTAAVSFGDTGLTLAEGDSLTFTIFLLPESDLNDLTFRIIKTGGAGYIQTPLKYDASSWIPFGRCKKHFINGLFVNEGVKWTLAFNPQVDPWDNTGIDQTIKDPSSSSLPSLIKWDAGEIADINLKESVAEFSLESGSDAIQIFSEKPSTSKRIGIISTLNGEAQGWKIKSVEGVDVDAASYSNDGLAISIDGETLVVNDNRPAGNKGEHNYWTGHGDWSPASWSDKGAIDLSMYDVLSNDSGPVSRDMSTANCYIIRHAGKYRIPLVYGNAINNGGGNGAAYAGATGGLQPFVDCNNHDIASPFIENHTTIGGLIPDKARTNALDIDGVAVLWQENEGVITTGTNPLIGTKLKKNDNPYLYTMSTVRYIEFDVNQNKICQNNAVICAYKDLNSNGQFDSGEAVWSWHIWVTNDPAVKNTSGITAGLFTYFPSPCLGWIEPLCYEQKDDVAVTLVQDETEETLEITVKRQAYHNPGSGTYYQWGRKDPMPSKESVIGTFGINKTNLNTGVTLGAGIKYANYFYCRDYFHKANWCSSDYNNLWIGSPSKQIKTIYDPSPVGYKVPARGAFKFAICDSGESRNPSEWMYDGTAMSVLKGYTFTPFSVPLFFPAAGYRAYGDNSEEAIVGGKINRMGQNGYYWTASTQYDISDRYMYSWALGFSSSYVNSDSNASYIKSDGLSVRPVKE